MKSVECQKKHQTDLILPSPPAEMDTARQKFISYFWKETEREICLCDLTHGQIDSFHPVGIEYWSYFS